MYLYNNLSIKHQSIIKHYVFKLLCGSDLTKLALRHRTDKAGDHHYTQHYAKYFNPYRKSCRVLLEIGIGGYENPMAGGSSLRMWQSYFSRATIVGIDIHSKTPHRTSRIQTFQGDQTDAAFLDEVLKKVGTPEIIIDDGSHLNHHVIKTFQILFPKLKSGGIYVVEDTQTSYWDDFRGLNWGGNRDLNAKGTTMSFFKGLVDGLNYSEFLDPDYQPTYYDLNIVGIHFYHNLIFIEKGDNNEPSNLVQKI